MQKQVLVTRPNQLRGYLIPSWDADERLGPMRSSHTVVLWSSHDPPVNVETHHLPSEHPLELGPMGVITFSLHRHPDYVFAGAFFLSIERRMKTFISGFTIPLESLRLS